MAVAFALASALCYGLSDYLAGVTSRTWDSRVVTAAAQLIGVITAVVAVLLFPGNGPAAAPILWGRSAGSAARSECSRSTGGSPSAA